MSSEQPTHSSVNLAPGQRPKWETSGKRLRKNESRTV